MTIIGNSEDYLDEWKALKSPKTHTNTHHSEDKVNEAAFTSVVWYLLSHQTCIHFTESETLSWYSTEATIKKLKIHSRYKKTLTHTESSSHVRIHSSEWCLYKHLMNLDIWPNILWQVFISVCNVRPIASDASGPLRAAVQAYWCINLHQFWPPSRET